MTWEQIDNGSTRGTRGSEEGIVECDEEYSTSARITLEHDCTIAPFAITSGVYGWMFHTCYFSKRDEACLEFDAMKSKLAEIVALIPESNDPDSEAKCKLVVDAIQAFVSRFP